MSVNLIRVSNLLALVSLFNSFSYYSFLQISTFSLKSWEMVRYPSTIHVTNCTLS